MFGILDTHEISEIYENREDFSPERWQNLQPDHNLLPFGAGPRICVGRQYAELLMKIFTVNLVDQCEWTLENENPKLSRLPVFHPKDLLPATFSRKTFLEKPNGITKKIV